MSPFEEGAKSRHLGFPSIPVWSSLLFPRQRKSLVKDPGKEGKGLGAVLTPAHQVTRRS